MRFHRMIYFLLLLLLCILATKSNKYIGYRKKKEISPEESLSVCLILATWLETMPF